MVEMKDVTFICLPETGFEAPHNIESLRVSGEETFASLKSECQSGGRTRDLQLFRSKNVCHFKIIIDVQLALLFFF